MDNFRGGRAVKDYYKESLTAKARPRNCPHCGRMGHFATNWYEVGKRLPLVMAEGVTLCDNCKGSAQRADDVLHGMRIWYCSGCAICLCGTCQRTLPGDK